MTSGRPILTASSRLDKQRVSLVAIYPTIRLFRLFTSIVSSRYNQGGSYKNKNIDQSLE